MKKEGKGKGKGKESSHLGVPVWFAFAVHYLRVHCMGTLAWRATVCGIPSLSLATRNGEPSTGGKEGRESTQREKERERKRGQRRHEQRRESGVKREMKGTRIQ